MIHATGLAERECSEEATPVLSALSHNGKCNRLKPGQSWFEPRGSHVNEKTSTSDIVLQPYDPKMLDKILRANDHQLGLIIKSSQRKFARYMMSTPETRQKYDLK